MFSGTLLSVSGGTCNCFPGLTCFRRNRSAAIQSTRLNQKYAQAGFKAVFLPVDNSLYELKDLFPPENHVGKWITLVCGNRGDYIVANTDSMNFASFPKEALNTTGAGIVSEDLQRFLKPLFDKTLAGQDLQLLVIIDNVTYILNSFCLRKDHVTLGAALFIREFHAGPDLGHFVSSVRRSMDGSHADG
jgi:hypothetical protein